MTSLGGGRGLRGRITWSCLACVSAVTTVSHTLAALLLFGAVIAGTLKRFVGEEVTAAQEVFT